MKITWIGHSCFKIEKDDYAIIIDPYADGSVPGYSPVRETADMVLCTHEHADHNFRDGVELIERTGIPFNIEAIDTYHDEVRGAKRGPNKIYIIDDGETKVAHFGDLGCDLTPDQIEKLQNLDAAMIPVGGFFTINAKQAAALVSVLNPKTVIPMHYRSDAEYFGYDVIGTVAEFTEIMESRALQNRQKAMARPASLIRSANQGHIMESVNTIPESEITISKTSEPTAQVLVLQPRNLAVKSGKEVR